MKYELMHEENKAVRVIASIKDFDGDVVKWKMSFYDLWRLQMTWSFAHLIEVIETGRQGNVKVHMIVKKNYFRSLLNTMEDLGYRNIESEEESFVFVDSYASSPNEDKFLDVVID